MNTLGCMKHRTRKWWETNKYAFETESVSGVVVASVSGQMLPDRETATSPLSHSVEREQPWWTQ